MNASYAKRKEAGHTFPRGPLLERQYSTAISYLMHLTHVNRWKGSCRRNSFKATRANLWYTRISLMGLTTGA